MRDFMWAWGSFIQPHQQRNCFVKRPEDEREDPHGHGSSATPDTAGLASSLLPTPGPWVTNGSDVH